MDKTKTDSNNSAIEQQIHLEEARKARVDAERKSKKQASREAAKKEAAKTIKKLPIKVKVGGLIALVVLIAVVCGVVLPLALDHDETQYVSETTLKDAVNIENLAAVDYVYKGIAEKENSFLWMDKVDYRVKYEAHVRANYNLSEIQFTVDNGSKTAVAYLPEAQIGTPVLDEMKFGYLPENATADMKDVLALCKEDAIADLNSGEMQREASESLQATVTALTMPFLGKDWKLEFKSLSEYDGPEGVQNEN